MALIKCYECSKEISDKAENCPNCGAPKSEKSIIEENSNENISTEKPDLKEQKETLEQESSNIISQAFSKYLLGNFRLNRARYWKYIAIISMLLSLVWIVYVVATGGLPLLNAGIIFITILSSFFFTIFLVIPLNLARFHDVGFKSWKLLKYYPFIVFFFWLQKLNWTDYNQEMYFDVIAFLLMIYIINRLSKKGQHYANEWGVNPNDKYEGEYNNGKRNGEGTCYFANGDIYIGQFKNNHMHGKGIYKHTDGTTDEGFWEDDNYIEE